MIMPRPACRLMLLLNYVVLSLAIPGHAAPPVQHALRGELKAVSWTAPPTDCKHISGMIWVKADTDPVAAAKESLQKPPGMAAIFLWDMANPLLNNPLDAPRAPDGQLTKFKGLWPTHGAAELNQKATQFFTAYKAAGGRLDYLVLDFEDGLSNWQLKPEDVQAIEQDPRSASIKQQIGMTDLARVMDFFKGPEYLTWNALTGKIVCEALNEALFNPVLALYPRAKTSNYGAYILTKENMVPELNGHKQFSLAYCGTHGSPAFYGGIGNLAMAHLAGDQEYGRSPFAVLRWELNMMRGMRRSSAVPVLPWIAYKNFPGSSYRGNDYYQEIIYHLALTGADDFLFWNPGTGAKDQKSEESRTDEHDRLVDSCLATLNQKFGTAPRECQTLQPMAWDSPLITTGMKVGNKMLWRVTVPPGTQQVKVLPTGRILEVKDGAGLWYESQAGAEARFEIIPSAAH